MTRLAGAITMAVVEEYGPEEMLRRLADPRWFQAFGCVLGFDWHSSGVTTVTCGALKEAARRRGDDLGILVAGGKGRASRRTPREIAEAAERGSIAGGERLIRASRMSAKVDSAAVQDGYRVYHHSFFCLPGGAWCVVQQGMSPGARRARRYHWLGEAVEDFVCEPHAGIEELGTGRAEEDPQLDLLNLVAREGAPNRATSAALAREDPDRLAREVARLTEGPTLFAPDRHPLLPFDVDVSRLRRALRRVHERHPDDFETLLGTRGVGAATVRGIALVAEVVHGVPASRRDPASPRDPDDPAEPGGSGRAGGDGWAEYAYAHGGKDGVPYPVDRARYDRSIAVLEGAVRAARLGRREKSDALRRLGHARDRTAPGARARDRDRAAGGAAGQGTAPEAREMG